MNILLIVDGNAILHRAYHALPPLTNKEGKVVNAVYGFFSMLLKVIQEVNPTHLIVCFDRPKPTFRKMLYAGYQAHRPQMADDLSSQIIVLHEALEKIGVQIFEVDGFEADDVIGTIAVQSVSMDKEMRVKIITGDRDLLQLVNDRTHILFPVSGITNMVEFDAQKVEEKFGVRPDQFIDYKALTGDASDGYQGVTGIGPKTAGNLLREFGSFENLYKAIDRIPPKIAQKLAIDSEQAALAKKLAEIVTNVPITFHSNACQIDTINKEKMEEVFDDLSFTSLKNRLAAFALISSTKEKAVTGKQMSLL